MSDQYSTTNTKPIDEPKEDPDPDGGLSDAERALIVSIHPPASTSCHVICLHVLTKYATNRRKNFSEDWTSS